MAITSTSLTTNRSGNGQKPLPEQITAEEADLVKRLRQGQEWACNRLVTLYQDRLLKIAYGITLDHEESREIVQDVFVSAITKISGFHGENGLSPWLRKITVNACLNWKRKWKRRFRWHHTSLEQDTEYLLYDEARRGDTPETQLREKQKQDDLARAISRLPEKIRAVFILSTVEGLSYKEISQTLDIKQGTVSSRLHRARKILLDEMKKKSQGAYHGIV